MAEKLVPGGFLGAGGLQIPDVDPTETLAATYNAGANAADQTMTLTNAHGGGVTIDGSGVPFTGASSLQILAPNAGVVAFPRVGGLSVLSSISVASAPGATWREVDLQGSALTLTGAPAAIVKLAMVNIAGGTITGPGGNTVADAYTLFVDAPPSTGTEVISRPWSLGVAGAMQARGGLVLGAGFGAPGENDLVVAAGAVNVSQANTGRLGYLAGATQQFVVSLNGAAYVPLLVGPAASGFTVGSVPFGSATGALIQNNTKFFWDNTNIRLGLNIGAPLQTLQVNGNIALTVAGQKFIFGSSATDTNNSLFRDPSGSTVLSSPLNILLGTASTPFVQIVNLGSSDGGNVGIGVAPADASRLHVVAVRSVVAAAGAAWNGINFAASTLTLTGATTPITTLNFVTIAAPTITAASAVVTTDFFTCRIGAATFAGAGPASATRSWSLGIDGNTKFGGGIVVFGKQILIAASPYAILQTDYMLEVQSNTGAITVTLPALTGGTVSNGRIYVVQDSGYNAAANNITIARGNVADKINNVAGSYVQNISGAVIWLKANTTNNNWEIV